MKKMRLGNSRYSSHARINWLSVSVLAAFALSIATEYTNTTKIKIEGWTEVNKDWPLKEKQFFVAVEKGHHFIEVKLPQKLANDISIRLEYYYTFKNVRPLFQIVPCKTNIDILENHEDHLKAGVWHEHKLQVRRTDCERRNKLEYNVLLHDADDVFAWRVVELSSVISSTEETTTTTTAATITTLSPSTVETTTSQVNAQTDSTSTLSDQVINENDNSGPSPAQTESTTSSPERPQSTTTSGFKYDDNIEAGRSENELWPTFSPQSSIIDSPNSPENNKDNRYNLRPRRTTDGNSEANGLVHRFRRWLSGDDSKPVANLQMVCRPGFCDRSQFNFKRFLELVKGVPAIADDQLEAGLQLLLNTNNKPLEVTAKSASNNFLEVDPCVNMTLFMDAGTSMDFKLGDDEAKTKSRLLEKIERKACDSGAGKWEQFSRCISDYMPKLETVGQDAHKLHLSFAPERAPPGKQVAILVDPKRPLTLRFPYPTYSYLPNLLDKDQEVDHTRVLNNFWVLDADGVQKAQFKLSNLVPEVSTSEQGANPQRVVQVTNIDPKQESFDLTSRWINISDLQSLKNPVRFEYLADPADWVDRVEFWYQDVVSNTWRSYNDLKIGPPESTSDSTPVRPSTEAPQETTTTTTINEGSTTSQPPTGETEISATPSQTESTSTPTEVSPSTEASASSSEAPSPTTTTPLPTTTTAAPTTSTPNVSEQTSTVASSTAPTAPELRVDIKGLPAREFRVRVRHYLTEAARNSDVLRNLTIRTLALGDLCADISSPPYCLNGGKCKPTGTSTAECECLPGYSGERCQVKRPCQMIYDGKTGDELCSLANATCVPELPVFRCLFPNDEYFRCEQLYQVDTNGEKIPRLTDGDLMTKLNESRRLNIILTVFTLALLLFSVIIIINVVKRLMESKRRLRRAESEAHEMARRAQPGTSTSGAAFGRPQTGRNKPPVSISYNNQAFDAD